MRIHKILSTIGLLGIFLLPAGAFATGGYTPDFAGEPYTTDLTSCYTSYNSGIYECAVNSYVLTAWTGSDAMSPCATVASAPTWDNTGTSSTTASTSNATSTGGFYFDCLGDDASTYDNWVCRPDSDNIANHIATTCTGLATSTYATVTQGSNANCLSGYTNCDTDLTDCEIQSNVTSYPGAANAVYNSSCSAVCDATHLSCDGTSTDPANDVDGCEILEGSTAAAEPNTVYNTSCSTRLCDATHFLLQGDSMTTEGCLGVLAEACTVTASTLPGTCTGAGTTGTLTSNGTETCACSELDIPEFATGGYVDADGAYTQAVAEFETSDPLLWGKQTGTGGFIDFADGTGTKFAVDNTGKITSGFIGTADLSTGGGTDGYVLAVSSGVPTWMSPGSLTVTGDNMGDHTATETLKMGANKIVSGVADTKGIAIATSTGNVTMDGTLTANGTGASSVGGAFTVGGDLTVNGTGSSSVGGAFTAGGNLTVNGTGVSAIAGDLTVSDGDLVLGDTDSAGTIQLSDGSSNTMTLQTGAMSGDLSITLPTAAPAVDGLVLTTNTSGVTSWTYKTGDDLTCANGEVMRWNTTGSVWECANPGVITAQTLDDAYDTGTNAATRTVAIDSDAIKFNGSNGSNNVFELAQTNTSATGDVIELINQGLGNAIRINDGTSDIFVVDANGNIVIASDTGAPLTVNTNELVVDANGNTIVKQLGLLSTTADGNGKPNFTCDGTVVGYIAYALGSGVGNYYGCKEVSTGVYAWISLEVFGA
jgi:hypothetical protein